MSVAAIVSKVRRLQKLQAETREKIQPTSAEVRPTVDVSRWSNDFIGFASLLDIIPKEGPPQKLRPNAIQSAFETSRAGWDIVLKPRQVGLTTWELARDVWFFLTRPGAQVVVVCQSDKDDAAIKGNAEKVARYFTALREAGVVITFRSSSTTHWVLSTGASLSIIGAGASEKSAQKKGRSGTIHRLHITECAFFEHARTSMNALLECVPPRDLGSEIVIESTANGAAGFFFEFYRSSRDGRKASYKAHFFPWIEQSEYTSALEPGELVTPENERERELVARHMVTPEQLKWYRAKVADKGDPDLVDQEYPTDEETCWITPGRTFFSKDQTKRLLTETRDPIAVEEISRSGAAGKLFVWAAPEPHRDYVIAVDPSEGARGLSEASSGDPGAAVVYRRDTGEHVATLHGWFTPWEMGRLVADLGRRYNEALIVVERNNHGHAVLQALVQGEQYRRIWEDHDGKAGWINTAVKRAASLEALEAAHRDGTWTTPDRGSLDEFNLFVVLNGKPQAGPGAHDDRVMAHVIAYSVLTVPQAPLPSTGHGRSQSRYADGMGSWGRGGGGLGSWGRR